MACHGTPCHIPSTIFTRYKYRPFTFHGIFDYRFTLTMFLEALGQYDSNLFLVAEKWGPEMGVRKAMQLILQILETTIRSITQLIAYPVIKAQDLGSERDGVTCEF